MRDPDPRDALFDTAGLREGLDRRTGNASILVLAISTLKVVLLFGGIAVIARLVPPAEYGVFALAMPVIAIAMSLSSFGLPQAIVRRPEITHGEVSTLFWLNTALAALAACAVVALAGPAARLFDEPRVVPVYQVIAVAVVISAMVGQYSAIMRRRLHITRFEILSLIGEAAGLAVAIGAALAGLSYWALVAQQITVPLVTAALAAVATGWLPSGPRRARLGPILDMIHFGGYMAGVGLVNQLIQHVGTAIVGATQAAAATGLYHRAVRLGNMPPLRIMAPLSGAFVPALSRVQDDPAAFRALYVRLISRANLILLPAAVLIAAGAVPFVALLLGPDWGAAAPLLFWMSLFTLRAGGNHGLRYAMIACGRSQPLFLLTLMRLGIVTGALFLAAPHGIETMVASYMLIELGLTLPVVMAVAVRVTPLDWTSLWQASLAPMAFAVAVAGGLIWLVDPRLSALPPFWHLAALAAATGAVYGLRVALSPDLRGEARRVLDRLSARLASRRNPAA